MFGATISSHSGGCLRAAAWKGAAAMRFPRCSPKANECEQELAEHVRNHQSASRGSRLNRFQNKESLNELL